MGRIVSGLVGGIFVLLAIILYLSYSKAFDYKPIYIVNSEVKSDSLDIKSLQVLKELEIKGVLLTPSEYTSNIASYYNTLIAFLITLFIVFSFIGFFSMKIASKKDIQETLDEMLNDSLKFRGTVIESLYGKIEDEFVNKEEFSKDIEDLQKQINNITQDEQESLKPELDEIIYDGSKG